MLKRTLKHSTIVVSLALLVNPYDSFANENTTDIFVTIGIPKITKIVSNEDLSFGAIDYSALENGIEVSANLCVFSTSDAFNIKATSDGSSGYVLDGGLVGNNTIIYSLQFGILNNPTASLTDDAFTTANYTSSNDRNCNNNTHTIKASIDANNLNGVDLEGNYTDTLTLTVAPV